MGPQPTMISVLIRRRPYEDRGTQGKHHMKTELWNKATISQGVPEATRR